MSLLVDDLEDLLDGGIVLAPVVDLGGTNEDDEDGLPGTAGGALLLVGGFWGCDFEENVLQLWDSDSEADMTCSNISSSTNSSISPLLSEDSTTISSSSSSSSSIISSSIISSSIIVPVAVSSSTISSSINSSSSCD